MKKKGCKKQNKRQKYKILSKGMICIDIVNTKYQRIPAIPEKRRCVPGS